MGVFAPKKGQIQYINHLIKEGKLKKKDGTTDNGE